MPRVYIFTIIFSITLGVILDRVAVKRSLNILDLIFIAALLLMLYGNEKKAFLEGLLRSRARTFIGVSVMTLVLLAFLFVLYSFH